MALYLEAVNHFVWGIPTLVLIITTGIYFTVRTKGAQFRLFPDALRFFLKSFQTNKTEKNDISGYRALCTALAGTVGTGNLAGVAGAIAIGGPGSIFWMWICGVLAMITKFAEVTLALTFRQRTHDGCHLGGPMYMIRNGLNRKYRYLAYFYCFFGVLASYGVGNAAQVNAVVDSTYSVFIMFGVPKLKWIGIIIGFLLAMIVVSVLNGGAQRIGVWTEKLIPFAAIAYILTAVTVLILRKEYVLPSIEKIIYGAFAPKAVTGGILGSFFQTFRIGASRGVFTNEAGMGTASIAHASAITEHPVQQGLLGIIEVFLDTIVICTLTALVILSCIPVISYGFDSGIQLTLDAFSTVFGSWVQIPLLLIVVILALASILGWGLYGTRCAQFLLGKESCRYYIYTHGIIIVIASVMNTSTVWSFSELANGLMAIPNLIVLILLSPEFIYAVRAYEKNKAYRI